MLLSRLPIDLSQLFVEFPGDFIYYLLVIALSQASLMLVLSQRQRLENRQVARRYLVIHLLMVGLWGVLLISTMVVRATSELSASLLPPLDYAVTVLNLALVFWLLLTREDQVTRLRARGFLAVVTLLVIGLAILTLQQWSPVATLTDFNLTFWAWLWAMVVFVLAWIGIATNVILFRYVVDAPLKLLMMVGVALGAGMTIYQWLQGGLIGNYSGWLRLASLLAFALLPALVYRMFMRQIDQQLQYIFSSPSASASIETQTVASVPSAKPKDRTSEKSGDYHSAQLLRALGLILQTSDPAEIPSSIVETACEVLHADVAALLRVQDANYADFVVLRDTVNEHRSRGLSLNLDNQPTLTNALERRSQRTLYLDRNVDEINDLYTRMDIEQQGPVYFQPLNSGQDVIAMLLIANPYTQRELNRGEVELLKGMGIIASNLLNLSYKAEEAKSLAEDRVIQALVEGVTPDNINDTSARESRQTIESHLSDARDQINVLNRQVMQLKIALDDERTRIANLLTDTAEDLSVSQKIMALNDEQITLREERDELSRRLQEAEAILSGMTQSEDGVSKHQVEMLISERQSLQEERDKLQRQLDDLYAKDRAVVPEMQSVLNDMLKERDRLSQERSQLQHRLDTMQAELEALGFDTSSTGVSGLINQLYQERNSLKQQLERLQQERDTSLGELTRLKTLMSDEDARSERIQKLEKQVENLASDREVAIRQQDKLKGQLVTLSEKLGQVKEHRARLLAQVSGMEIQLSEVNDDQIKLRAQLQDIANERSQLTEERSRLQAENQALTTERDQLLARINDDPRRLQEVNHLGVGTLKQMIDDLSEERRQLEWQLNDVRSRLVTAEERVQKMKRTTTTISPIADADIQQGEMIYSLVQDLRTPLTSVVGYVDLLLGESAGILGEMQRKFLQRVMVNVDRLHTMLEDMLKIMQLDTGSLSLTSTAVNMITILEDAITSESLHFREKEIVLNLDFSDDLPTIQADHDAMVQVVNQLLSNAYLASPPLSTITIFAKPYELEDAEMRVPSVHIAITDSGGGIDPDDTPRVFSRKYRTDHPLVAGLGDTGVGLAIAKALVDAHHGDLWVTSTLGKGSTFNVALPIENVGVTS
jgi:signal transduction histidine kinase